MKILLFVLLIMVAPALTMASTPTAMDPRFEQMFRNSCSGQISAAIAKSYEVKKPKKPFFSKVDDQKILEFVSYLEKNQQKMQQLKARDAQVDPEFAKQATQRFSDNATLLDKVAPTQMKLCLELNHSLLEACKGSEPAQMQECLSKTAKGEDFKKRQESFLNLTSE